MLLPLAARRAVLAIGNDAAAIVLAIGPDTAAIGC